jgi:hypothetical protein
VKTQILHLESFDDRHSVLDKLNWGQADRVIMIWPVRGVPLASKLDLKLIHRRCQSSEMKLALVCKKREVVDFASELGIPVFRSLRQAQRVAWEYTLPPHQEIRRPANKRSREELARLIQDSSPPAWTQTKAFRITAFIISIVSVLVLAAFLIPGARIEYLPKFETQTLPLTISANQEYQTYNLSGAIPAHLLTITVEGRREREPSGQTGIPDNPAKGLIVFSNLTDQEITIPQGTIIRTTDPNSPYRFTTLSETTINPESGATTRVPIECTNPGPQGNLPENSLVVIEGDLSRSLTATNPEPTTGGDERLSRSPTLDDYQTLSEDLLASLWQTALDEAALLLEEKDIIVDTEPRTAVILEETFTPQEPEPSSTLSLLLRVEYEILYLKWNEIQTMGNAILDVTLPDGYSAQPQTIQIESVTPPEVGDTEQVVWEVEISRKIFTIQALPQTIDQILGRTPEKATQIFKKEMGLSQGPTISLFPEWWPLIPLSELRIETVTLH